MLTRDASKYFFNAAQAFRQLAEAMDELHRAMQSDTGTAAPAPAQQAAFAAPAPAQQAAPAAPVPGGALTLEQFNVKVVELIRANPNRGPAAKQMLTRYAPNGGGAPEIDPAQYGNFLAELEQAQ